MQLLLLVLLSPSFACEWNLSESKAAAVIIVRFPSAERGTQRQRRCSRLCACAMPALPTGCFWVHGRRLHLLGQPGRPPWAPGCVAVTVHAQRRRRVVQRSRAVVSSHAGVAMPRWFGSRWGTCSAGAVLRVPAAVDVSTPPQRCAVRSLCRPDVVGFYADVAGTPCHCRTASRWAACYRPYALSWCCRRLTGGGSSR